MKPLFFTSCAGALLVSTALVVASLAETTERKSTSPIYGVSIPDGYRQWELIAAALEAAPLNELHAVVGNKTTVDASKREGLPYPDGSIFVKLAWKQTQSVFAPASVPGAPTTVQVMIKDSKKYKASGGWGFGRFVNGKAVDEGQHQTCFACHEGLAKEHDYVFTRYAP